MSRADTKEDEGEHGRTGGQIGFGIIGLGFGESRCAMVQEVPEARLVAVESRTAPALEFDVPE